MAAARRETAVMFSTGAINAQRRSANSLTIRLNPALTLPPGQAAFMRLDSFRFINHLDNVSAALGNNKLRVRWGHDDRIFPSGTVSSNEGTVTIRDGNYSLSTLAAEINTQLRALPHWPAHSASYTKTTSSDVSKNTGDNVLTLAAGQGLTQAAVGLVASNMYMPAGTTVTQVSADGLTVTLNQATGISLSSATITFGSHADVTESGSTAPLTLAADTTHNRVTATIDSSMWQDNASEKWWIELFDLLDDDGPTSVDAVEFLTALHSDMTYTVTERTYTANNASFSDVAATVTLPKGYYTLEQFHTLWNDQIAAVTAPGQAGEPWSATTTAGLVWLGTGYTLDANSAGAVGALTNNFRGPSIAAWQAEAAASSYRVERFITTTNGFVLTARATGQLVGPQQAGFVHDAFYAGATAGSLLVLRKTSDPHVLSMMGFRPEQQPLGSYFADVAASDGTSHTTGHVYTALDPARFDRANVIRVECDRVTGNYAPPDRHSHDGHSRGNSDALAFIPIVASPGHQQVFNPPNPLHATVASGEVNELTLSLLDQCGDAVDLDEPWSGCLIVSHAVPP